MLKYCTVHVGKYYNSHEKFKIKNLETTCSPVHRIQLPLFLKACFETIFIATVSVLVPDAQNQQSTWLVIAKPWKFVLSIKCKVHPKRGKLAESFQQSSTTKPALGSGAKTSSLPRSLSACLQPPCPPQGKPSS